MWKTIKFYERKFLRRFKVFWKKNKIKIDIINDNSLTIPEYKLDFKSRSKKTIEKIESLTKLINLKDLKKDNNVYSLNKTIKKNKFKKNKFKKNKFYKKKFYKKKVK